MKRRLKELLSNNLDCSEFSHKSNALKLTKSHVIERFEQPGRSLQVGEILGEQKRFYHELGVSPPNSL